ncbi:unnamed protein product [Prorocentrum cordatum]|uniref:Uncharacterized protein n=1 Tax=Prorocentrum cordatum TaxID=2364126 RepID=A0ABN9UN39_9DINO|nr:unnamed protein product [Polarella glacialis]
MSTPDSSIPKAGAPAPQEARCKRRAPRRDHAPPGGSGGQRAGAGEGSPRLGGPRPRAMLALWENLGGWLFAGSGPPALARGGRSGSGGDEERLAAKAGAGFLRGFGGFQ